MSEEELLAFCSAIDSRYNINWHHEFIAWKLQEAFEKVSKGERARIILTLPPRHGKSDLASIKFPAWVLGKRPDWSIIITSYAQDKATDFGLETRDIMNLGNYQEIFKTRLRTDTRAKAKWLTDKKGGYTAVGVGGPITGRGFNIGIIDDPIKNREEADSEVVRESTWKWYQGTFLTREEGNGAIIVIVTRWHDDDLIGRILKEDEEKEWEVINFPAIAENDEKYRKKGEALWPWRFPLEILEKRKTDVGPYEWSAQYQQNPVDVESQEFKREWFHTRTWKELENLSLRRFVTIDPASAMHDKSDYIGITDNYIDRENKWNLKAFRVRANSMELIRLMFKIDTEGLIPIEKIGIEQGVYKDAIKPFLEEEMQKRNHFFEIVELKHEQIQKNTRIRGLIPRYSSGSIFHIEGECIDLEEEALRFPKGVNDDVIDSLAYQNQVAEAPDVGDIQARLRIQELRQQRKQRDNL